MFSPRSSLAAKPGPRRRATAVGALLTAAAASAFAQAQPAATATATEVPGFLVRAADSGVYFRAFFNQEIAGNTSGGIDQGITSSQYVLGGMDVDLEKVFGWTGGKFRATIISLKSKGLTAEYIGGGPSVQENYGAFALTRFTELVLDQSFDTADRKNAVNWLIGRFGATSQFGRSDYARYFMNHAFCGPMYGFSQVTGTANTPLSSWATRLRVNLDQNMYTQFGVFVADPAILDPNVKLFEINASRVNGTNYMVEVGQETTFANSEKPHYIRAGGWYLDAPRNNVYYNRNGQSFTRFGGQREIEDTGTGAYITAGKVIQRDAGSNRNLAVFGSVIKSMNGYEPLASTVKVGLVKTGTFAGRERDAIALGVTNLQLSGAMSNYLTEQRARGGGTGRVGKDSQVVELSYTYEARPGVQITPNLQYLRNPDPRVTPRYPGDIPNATVIGLKLQINLGTLMGLPVAGARR